jgi:D-xylose transport system substrate-binding protein
LVKLTLAGAVIALGIATGGAVPALAQDPVKIGFLSPCTQCSDRWEQKDRPFFIEAVKRLDPTIEIIATNAQGDQNRLIAQAEAALAQGADVLVVNTIQENGAVPIIEAAHRQGVPVIAYDALIRGAVPDGYISFNNEEVGRLQAQFVLDHVPEGGNVVLINGEQFCDACRAFKRGAHAVLDEADASGRINLVFEGEAKGWLPANAQALMEQALTQTNNEVAGVVAANDGLAQGVIAALTNVGLNGKVVVTGQDATDAALTNILIGDQTMTVYKALQIQAGAAAEAAVALARKQDISSVFPDTVNNETGDVASLLLKPGIVTVHNLESTVIADGYAQKEKICVGPAADKCNF